MRVDPLLRWSVIMAFFLALSMGRIAHGGDDKKPEFKPVAGAESSATEEATQMQEARPAQAGEGLSDTVAFVRKMGDTEVFFKTQKTSFFIPNSSKHNKILEKMVESQKNQKPVSVQVDRTQRRILDLSESSGREPAGVGKPASPASATQ